MVSSANIETNRKIVMAAALAEPSFESMSAERESALGGDVDDRVRLRTSERLLVTTFSNIEPSAAFQRSFAGRRRSNLL